MIAARKIATITSRGIILLMTANSQRVPRNEEMVAGLAVDFPRRREASHQWARAIGLIQALPGLRGFWPGVIGNDVLVDMSGNGQNLTRNAGGRVSRRGIIPTIECPGGSSDSFSAADNAIFDIIGTETIIAAALRGLTIGCWYQIDDIGSGNDFMMAKWTAATATNGSYALYQGSGVLSFRVTNGTTDYAASISGAVVAGTWAFACGRFAPGVDVYISQNDGAATAGGAGAPATANNSTVNFSLGARSDNTNQINGRLALPFICASYLPPFFPQAIFHHTRDLFGA